MIDKVGGVILKDKKILVQRKNNGREVDTKYLGTYQDIAVFSNQSLQVITYLVKIEGETQCNNEIKEALWIDKNYKELGIKVGSILGEYVIPELIKRDLM